MIDSGATIVGNYRYNLWRIWDKSLPRMIFVALNPSTADAEKDDATIRKCLGFAKHFADAGGSAIVGSIVVVNLFAFRSRHPKILKQCRDPVGPLNDTQIKWATSNPKDIVVVAWGAHGDEYPERAKAVVELINRPLHCLAVTKSGQPCHPLMLSYNCVPMPWEMR